MSETLPPPIDTPPKRSGFKIFLYIVMGVGILFAVGICAFLVSPQGRSMMSGIKEFSQDMAQAMNAPGTEELKGIGCDVAMATTVGTLMSGVDKMVQETETQLDAEIADQVLVICKPRRDAAPDCATAAAAYGGAAQPAEPFIVMVESRDGVPCSGYFDRTGAYVGAVGDNFELVAE